MALGDLGAHLRVREAVGTQPADLQEHLLEAARSPKCEQRPTARSRAHHVYGPSGHHHEGSLLRLDLAVPEREPEGSFEHEEGFLQPAVDVGHGPATLGSAELGHCQSPLRLCIGEDEPHADGPEVGHLSLRLVQKVSVHGCNLSFAASAEPGRVSRASPPVAGRSIPNDWVTSCSWSENTALTPNTSPAARADCALCTLGARIS